MTVFEALKQAEHEYASLDRSQDHLAPDSDGYIDLGPIVPWILNRTVELCSMPIDHVRARYYSADYEIWYKRHRND